MPNHFIKILKISLVFCLFSCTQQAKTKEPTSAIIESKNKPPSSFSDTLKINSRSAVFYYPDSIQLEKIKGITDSNVFNSSMHEYFYQMRNARIVLKHFQPEIKIIDARNIRYLLFLYSDNKSDCIDLDSKNDSYGLILFNRQKPPLINDMANIESEAGFYFSK